jgi:pyridinium-3,5-bisthiocarboxylic acid mononucleotide nickel chelatase
MHLARIGYGLGMRDLERPNALRVWIGTTERWGDGAMGRRGEDVALAHSPTRPLAHSPAPVLLETNIDDQPAEQLAYAVERLFELGALDAWLVPIQMKKGRAATLLAALVPAALEDAAVALIMRETTTLGVRRRAVERHTCEREIVGVQTSLGLVRVKRKRWRGEDLGAAPEYEDCARLARAHGVPLPEVYRLALNEVKS